jgi:nicotinamidase/pyrazinamidase
VDALLIVDFQNDFCPGGALPVPAGDRIAEALEPLLDRFDLVIATRDWHPPDHGSFLGADVDPARWRGSDPPGTWPPHCVQGSEGAELHPGLDRSRLHVVIDKGQDRLSQGYSAFQDSPLEAILRQGGVDRVWIGGLATDYCVRASALDALALGLEVTVIEDAVRGIDIHPGDSERALDEMRAAGARVAPAAEVAASLTPRSER